MGCVECIIFNHFYMSGSRRRSDGLLHTLRGLGQGVRSASYTRGHDPEPGDHGTLSAREPVLARQAVGLEASSVIPILQKPSCEPRIGTSQSTSLWRWGRSCSVPHHRGAVPAPLQEQSAAPALFALRESPVGRMAPSPLDITSVARQPMDDCRRSEVRIVREISPNPRIRILT